MSKFMSLALHYRMRDAHHCSCPPPVSEMTYTVSSGTVNSTIPYHYHTIPWNAILSLQCCDIVDWVTGRASGL